MLQLVTFGGLTVRNGAVISGVANPRSRLAILAVLAVAGDRGIRREKLAAMFWPESDEERARNSLRQALFTLKRDVGAGDITTGAADLRLNPNVLTADVIEFEKAVQEHRVEDAAALYAGPFLDGVYLRESREFERWAEEQRSRLAAEFGRALEKAASIATERGDVASAVRWWERRSTHDPLSGRVARLHMEALARAGEREQAIRHAASHAEAVRKELETEPDPEVLAFAEQLRASSTSSRPRMPVYASAVPPDPPDTVRLTNETPGVSSPSTTTLGRSSPVVRLAIAAAVVVVTFLGARFLTKGPPIAPGLVAIGDFVNRTGDSTLDAVARLAGSGIIEVLTLSGHGGSLDLRATSTGTASRDPRKTPAEYVITGTLERRNNDSVTVIGRIVNARSGTTRLQMEPFTIALPDRNGIVDEVRERLGGAVVALGDTVFPLWRTGRSRPPRYSAYHEFMQGVDAIVQQGMEEAVQHFVKAMQLDTGFAQAKLWYLEQASGLAAERFRVDSVRAAVLAQRRTFVAYDQAATDRQVAFIDGRLEDMYTAARQMAALAPDAPDVKMLLAHAAFATRRYHEAIQQLHGVHEAPAWVSGLNLRRRWDLIAHRLLGEVDLGLAEWRQAIAENQNATLCELGVSLFAAAGRESSVDSLIVACNRLPESRTDPDRQLVFAAGHYRMSGHHKEAERAFRRALAIRIPLVARGDRPIGTVATIHLELGEWQAAYDLLRPLPTPNSNQRVMLGVAAAHLGDTATANKVIRWTETQSKRNGADMDRAFVEIALGRRDQAIASLRAAISSGVVPGWNNWYVRSELLPLRGDPRFEDLIRPVR